jgi:drug/metabolite transporter (DMT)-like permease
MSAVVRNFVKRVAAAAGFGAKTRNASHTYGVVHSADMSGEGEFDAQSSPARHGALVALSAALLFGLSTPLVQRFGSGIGSFTTASLLYAGAAISGILLMRPPGREARVRRSDAARLISVAACGAVVGPVALVWGLAHTSAASASLMLTLEAVFTALLARICYREFMDRRVFTGMLLLTLGAMVLILDRAALGRLQLAGILAVAAATGAWAVDNTLSRALAERDPGQVVLIKSALGAAATLLLAVWLGEAAPPLMPALGLFCTGATGYGLSLRLYLLAQRSFGAARTGSVFAFAPFAGAAFALALGDRSVSVWMIAGAALMIAGILLHLTEYHSHAHEHEYLEHEHAHTHDDGHHLHRHEPMPTGAHSHRHGHPPLRHSHPHTPDEHHRHHH